MQYLQILVAAFIRSLWDLFPVALVIGFFQIIVLQQPLPDLTNIILGVLMLAIGLTLFVQGLNMGLFPIGECMAYAFARKGSLFWLLAFAFALGFGSAIAEPALIAMTNEATHLFAKAQMIENTPVAIDQYAFELRIVVALSVGLAIVLGGFRLIKGWPIQYPIMAGYILILVITAFAPPEIIGIAYDIGGITTSTITVPLVTALGIGLARSIKGCNPMIDGFGLIAFAALMPILCVMSYGIIR